MKKQFLFFGMLIVALTLVFAGCVSAKSPNVEPASVDNSQADLPAKTIRWEADSDGFRQFYTNDAQYYDYYFTVSAITHSGDTYETEVKKMSGNASYGYGMLFCYDSTDTYYRMLITTDGAYNIAKRVAGMWAENPITPWTPSEAIVTGEGEMNTLKVVKSGNSFTASINGQQVATFADSDVIGTKIGAFAGVGKVDEESFPNIPVDVRFRVLQ
jgi:hypothetical protein